MFLNISYLRMGNSKNDIGVFGRSSTESDADA